MGLDRSMTMKFIPAFAALGLSTWFGYLVWMGTFPADGGGTSKTRAAIHLVHISIEKFGETYTSLGLVGIGSILAFYFVTRGLEDQRA